MKYNNRWRSFFACTVMATLALMACNKLDTTTIGNDLIPVVDNVNTFDTTLAVEARNFFYTDSVNVYASDVHALGTVLTDPLFGTTTASILAQFKPSAYGVYPFLNAKDSIVAIDSVVLGLSYKGAYGDTNLIQHIRVYEVDASERFYRGEKTTVDYPMFGQEVSVGNGMVDIRNLNDSATVILDKDTTKIANQLRIHLDTTLVGRAYAAYDTANAFRSDSAFNVYNKGFVVLTDSTYSSNGLMYFNLTEANSNLTIFYRVIKNGVMDTAYVVFPFGNVAGNVSAQANIIRRRYDGTQVNTYVNNGTAQDDLVFVQTLPGTTTTIDVPALTGGTIYNRVVHKAELIMEQVSDGSDATLGAPAYLYLDAFDDSVHVAVIDPMFYSSGTPELRLFGGYSKTIKDASGNNVTGYTFDLTRYVQMIATRNTKNLQFRLTAPTAPNNRLSAFHFNPLYPQPAYPNSTLGVYSIYPNAVANGRVRLGGGNHATNKMRLRIIYSKI
ncbi:MAG: DUF4270 family protein [Chitinophagaceae bacterium]